MTTIGFIGSGNIGSQVARAAIAHGYDVVMSNSRGPETLSDLIADLGPHARAATVLEAAEAGDWVVVTTPLAAIDGLPVDALAGKIVVDTNNYYFERDGHIPELDDEQITVSGILQRKLPASKVAKGFNHIGAGEITTTGTPAGTPNRRALATASDFPEASDAVIAFYDEVGFDAVNIGPLSESWRVQRDHHAYGKPQNADELRANLAKAVRNAPGK
jgi:predicted dinucleotide-binding enzyme